MKKASLVNFFDDYSKNVDNADKLGFWFLSDKIIEYIIQSHIDEIYQGTELSIIDAGCGTGRWIKKIINRNPDKKLKFIAYDLYESMLNKARKNLATDHNVQFIEGDLEDMKDVGSDSIDLCISIYSPISFLDKPNAFIKEMKRILKKGGRSLIMGHSYHNAIDSKINNYLADAKELEELSTEKLVRWNNSLPPLNVFSIEDFKKYGDANGIACAGGYGVPVYIKPQSEDWDSENIKKSGISLKLENDKAFLEKVFTLEVENNYKAELINRGVNIIAYFTK